jgi:TonB family protein
MGTEMASRTFVGSVVCVDLVGYSKRSIALQSAIKDTFNRLLVQGLKGIPLEDRIVLDTGDGAAISFLGDPEASLAVGLKLRDSMNAAAQELGAEPGEGPVRIAINLGPVKLAVDMNGHPNIIGDGINVAERIVGFAQPGQIVVSRSFHDMVSRISDDHGRIFRHEGLRTDKNARDHEIYSVEPAAPPAAPVPAEPARTEIAAVVASAARAVGPRREGAIVSFLRDPRKWGTAAAVLVMVIALLGAFLVDRARVPASSPALAPAAPAPSTEPPRPLPETPKAEETRGLVEPSKPPAAVAPALPESRVEPAKKPDAKPAPPESKAAPADAKAKAPIAPKRTEDAQRAVIPPPRTPPPVAPAPPSGLAAPQVEPTPAVREEPRAAPVAPDTTATPVSRAPVNFPPAAVNRGIESGSVRARLRINAAGNVTQVTVLSSVPPRIFDREAVRSLEEWKFNPGADNRSYEIEIGFKR